MCVLKKDIREFLCQFWFDNVIFVPAPIVFHRSMFIISSEPVVKSPSFLTSGLARSPSRPRKQASEKLASCKYPVEKWVCFLYHMKHGWQRHPRGRQFWAWQVGVRPQGRVSRHRRQARPQPMAWKRRIQHKPSPFLKNHVLLVSNTDHFTVTAYPKK